MPQLTEHFNNREREVFIRVKLHSLSLHKSFLALFVLTDGRFDLFRVRSGVSKGGFQVGGSEGRIVTEEILVGNPELTVSYQDPHRDAGIADTCIAALEIRPLGDPTRGCGHDFLSLNVWKEQ
jgi:hypothetical protein